MKKTFLHEATSWARKFAMNKFNVQYSFITLADGVAELRLPPLTPYTAFNILKKCVDVADYVEVCASTQGGYHIEIGGFPVSASRFDGECETIDIVFEVKDITKANGDFWSEDPADIRRVKILNRIASEKAPMFCDTSEAVNLGQFLPDKEA